jgi:hypothetical protein
MSVYEDLSRLLAGELDPGERARVEARIEAEPEVRAAWERLRTLPAQFDGLRAVPPPPARDRRVLGRPRLRLGLVAPWIAAAAGVAIAAAVLRPDPVEVAILAGTHEVDGDARVSAGSVEVELHGRARIARDGARVTVVVLSGSAVVQGEPLSAGQSADFGPAARRTVPAPIEPDADPRIAELEAENALRRVPGGRVGPGRDQADLRGPGSRGRAAGRDRPRSGGARGVLARVDPLAD